MTVMWTAFAVYAGDGECQQMYKAVGEVIESEARNEQKRAQNMNTEFVSFDAWISIWTLFEIAIRKFGFASSESTLLSFLIIGN